MLAIVVHRFTVLVSLSCTGSVPDDLHAARAGPSRRPVAWALPGLGFSRPGKGLPEAERSEPLPGREVPSTPLVGGGMAVWNEPPARASCHPGACPSGEDAGCYAVWELSVIGWPQVV